MARGDRTSATRHDRTRNFLGRKEKKNLMNSHNRRCISTFQKLHRQVLFWRWLLISGDIVRRQGGRSRRGRGRRDEREGERCDMTRRGSTQNRSDISMLTYEA